MMMWLVTRIQRLGAAWNGVAIAWGRDVHVVIHVAVMVGWAGLGSWVGLDGMGWALLIMGFGMVMLAELLNSAIERAVDTWSPSWSMAAKEVKDMAAGAVLMAVLAVSIAASGLMWHYYVP